MLTYQKNALLALLAQFEAKLYNLLVLEETSEDARLDLMFRHDQENNIYNIITRNSQSIRKQIKKL